MAGSSVACILLGPWPLTLLARQHPGVPVTVLDEHTRRVLHAGPEIRLLGVQPGLRETAALSRCPELHAEVVNGLAASAAWAELTETLYARYSDRVDGRTQGVLYLQVGPVAARELATALHAPVGLAASLEVAHLAALRAKVGEVREIGQNDEKTYLPLSVTAHLQVLGLSENDVTRLEFLGVHGLADLMKWSAAQREAFLGVNVGKRLNRFLRGERTALVARHVPGQVLGTVQRFDDPLQEPHEAEAALLELVPPLYEGLRGQTAAYLTLHTDTLGGRLSATRKLKWPVQAEGIRRLALRMVTDLGALSLGLDTLTLEFSGLQQPSRQVGLWPGPGELDAVREVLERYPTALVRVEWRDPFAYAADAQYVWVDWMTGAERPKLDQPRPEQPRFEQPRFEQPGRPSPVPDHIRNQSGPVPFRKALPLLKAER